MTPAEAAAGPPFGGPTLARVLDRLTGGPAADDGGLGERLAARLDAELHREERERDRPGAPGGAAADGAPAPSAEGPGERSPAEWTRYRSSRSRSRAPARNCWSTM